MLFLYRYTKQYICKNFLYHLHRQNINYILTYFLRLLPYDLMILLMLDVHKKKTRKRRKFIWDLGYKEYYLYENMNLTACPSISVFLKV